MKSVALKRSDRLRTQILVVVWVTVCTLFTLIPLFITVINAFKSNTEIERSIFAMPEVNILSDNIKNNFTLAWEGMSGAFFRSILVTIIGAIVDCILGSVLAYIFTYKQFHFKETIFMAYISVMLLPSIMGMPILVPFMKNTLKKSAI